jgi:hypothetical protein
MQRLWCWIRGHARSTRWYEPWDAYGRKRERTVWDICTRCEAILNQWQEPAR